MRHRRLGDGEAGTEEQRRQEREENLAAGHGSLLNEVGTSNKFVLDLFLPID